jgi:hypothetical protein
VAADLGVFHLKFHDLVDRLETTEAEKRGHRSLKEERIADCRKIYADIYR